MSDISQVQLGSKLYNVKDNTARQRMIDNTTDSDVNAIVNFINGLKINGNNVISQATADVVAISADDDYFTKYIGNEIYLGEVVDTN